MFSAVKNSENINCNFALQQWDYITYIIQQLSAKKKKKKRFNGSRLIHRSLHKPQLKS